MNEDKKDNISYKDKSVTSFEYDPSIFHADYSIYVLYRRIDNITAAIFLVTDVLPDTEMLKLSLRETCLKSLSGVVSFIGSPKADVASLQTVVAHVLELASKLNITFWTGLISEMNASILQKEVSKIHDALGEVMSKYRSKHSIDPVLFSRVDLDIRHYKNSTLEYKDKSPKVSMSYIKDITKGQVKRQNMSYTNPKTQPQEKMSSEDVSGNRVDRRNVILKLLGERSNLNIKDFATVIPSYSEKTIQRELLSLVEDGLVKKVGERRWSTYSLNNQ